MYKWVRETTSMSKHIKCMYRLESVELNRYLGNIYKGWGIWYLVEASLTSFPLKATTVKAAKKEAVEHFRLLFLKELRALPKYEARC